VLNRTAIRWLLAGAIAAVVPLGAQLWAMRVSPMVVEMSSAGSKATARVEVDNSGAGLLAFETHITRLDYDSEGKQVEVPADNDFLVFPPQGTLPANGRQVIRLQWLGGAEMPASRSYYMSVNQLPVAITPDAPGKSGGEVQIVYHMKALITVAPPNAKPAVEVVSATPTMVQPKYEEGQPVPAKVAGLTVKFRNTGTRYAMLAGARWVIDGTGTDKQPIHIELSREDLSRLIGVGYIAPTNGVRTFDVPLDKSFAPDSVKIRFQP